MLRLCGLFILLIGIALPSQAAYAERLTVWTDYPVLQKTGKPSRLRSQFSPLQLHSEQLTIFPSTDEQDKGKSWQVEVKNGRGTLASQGSGGYYWVQAKQEETHSVHLASTIQYFSNPGPAPRTMLTVVKSELEIRPLKLPREHRHYRSNEQWPFQVLYKGEPLKNAQVEFQTQHGTRQTFQGDEQGRFSLMFPEDFPKEVRSEHSAHHEYGRQKAAFVLATHFSDGQKQFVSAFNYHYAPDAYANKSIWLGIGFAIMGMSAASPLLCRRKKST